MVLAAAALLLALPAVVLCVFALFNSRVGVETDFSASPLLATAPGPLAAPITLKVATFNIQDLYVASEDRSLRMRSIGAKLIILDPDIVGFQEAFIASDRAILLKELESTRLKHHQYYPSGTVGSGLLIASAFPIREAYFHRFAASAPAYKIWEGDWWAGKGVALARLDIPDGQGILDFYNTHAQAGYGNPAYDQVRGEQMAELANFIVESRCGGAPALLVGDMNCGPGDPEFEAAVNGAKLRRVMKGDSRIDHIFAAEDAWHEAEAIDTEPITAVVNLSGRAIALSDHTGYMSTITIKPKQDSL